MKRAIVPKEPELVQTTSSVVRVCLQAPEATVRLFSCLGRRAHDVIAQPPVGEVEVLECGRVSQEDGDRHAPHGQHFSYELLPRRVALLAENARIPHDLDLHTPKKSRDWGL